MFKVVTNDRFLTITADHFEAGNLGVTFYGPTEETVAFIPLSSNLIYIVKEDN